MTRFAAAIILLVLAAGPAGADEHEALVDQLEGFDELLRERAFTRLLERGSAALPALRKRLPTSSRAVELRALIDRIEAEERERTAERSREPEVVRELEDQALLRKHWDQFVQRYFEDTLERARELGRAGRHDEGIALIDAMILVEPKLPRPLATQVDAVRRTLKSERFARHIAQGSIELSRKFFTWNEPLGLSFVLQNTGGQDLVLAARPAGGGNPAAGSVLQVRYLVRDHDLYGENRLQERTEELAVPDLRLGPGDRWRRPWTVAAPPAPSAAFVYREVAVSARLVPARMSSGDRLLDQLAVEFPPQTLRVFPAGYEQHAAEPLRSLAGALRLDQPDVAFVSALLVPSHRHAEAIELLVEGLGRRRASLARTSVALLERLTGERFERLDAWPLWWKAHKERFRPRE